MAEEAIATDQQRPASRRINRLPKKTAEPQGLRCWHHTVWNSLEQLSKLLRSRQAGAAGARNPHVPT
ncbi:hypothetical protein VDF96_17835, partial [Xanthomonas campestris pv. raphani]|nr:hypothetical protein [Xanthomonas campestris pv. raphani]